MVELGTPMSWDYERENVDLKGRINEMNDSFFGVFSQGKNRNEFIVRILCYFNTISIQRFSLTCK